MHNAASCKTGSIINYTIRCTNENNKYAIVDKTNNHSWMCSAITTTATRLHLRIRTSTKRMFQNDQGNTIRPRKKNQRSNRGALLPGTIWLRPDAIWKCRGWILSCSYHWGNFITVIKTYTGVGGTWTWVALMSVHSLTAVLSLGKYEK